MHSDGRDQPVANRPKAALDGGQQAASSGRCPATAYRHFTNVSARYSALSLSRPSSVAGWYQTRAQCALSRPFSRLLKGEYLA